MIILLNEIIVYFGFIVSKCNFIYFAKFWNATRLETRRYGCCFDKFVAWFTRFWPWVKTCIGFRWYWPWFAWIANWMGWKFNGTGHQCMGRQVRGLQNARAHSKCAGPRKMRGPTPSAWAALWVRGTPSARTHAKCVGRGSIAWAALSARAAIAWRGEWAALPTHVPRTCHAMATQCNRGPTRVGRDEPQSPGTLRIKNWNIVKPEYC